jgi:hypothetical protein
MQGDLGGWLILGIIVLIVAARFYRPKWEGSSDAHGTARWATEDDLKRRNMLED